MIRIMFFLCALLVSIPSAQAARGDLRSAPSPHPRATGSDLLTMRRDALHGDAMAQLKMGLLARQRGDAAEAWRWISLAAAQQLPQAEAELAILLYLGEGGERDFPRAAALARHAASTGDVTGQRVLGSLFAMGAGVEQSWPDALRWTREAAEQGDPRAQTNMASYLWSRTDTASAASIPDWPEIVSWYRRGIEKNDPAAHVDLGLLYVYGASGFTRDLDLGLTLLDHAAREWGDTSGSR